MLAFSVETAENRSEGGFRNPPGSPQNTNSVIETIQAYTDRIWESITGYHPKLSADFILSPDEVRQGRAAVEGRDSLTCLGHASFLIEFGGKTILTDPFLSEYATGVPPFGPQRATAPALTVEQLPQIGILLVSHNHYDHLDAPTIEALAGKAGIRVVVPLGMGAFFTQRGYTDVVELDWYEEATAGGVAVTAVPAIHGSGRGLSDRNEMLWAGFVLRNGGRKIYFAGDSGYGPVFAQIRRLIGPVDFALVPIGVFEPRRRMKSRHVNPQEALQIGLDLGAGIIVGMHWGTIRLSDEAFEEAPRLFREAADASGISERRAWILKIGESRPLD